MPTQQRLNARAITAQIDHLITLHRDADGVIDDAEVKKELTSFLSTRPDLLDAAHVATTKYEAYQAARAPYKQPAQGVVQAVLPGLDSIITIGTNRSILLREAKQRHLVERLRVISGQYDAQHNAFNRESSLLLEAMGRMQSPTDTYEDVMGKDYAP